MFLNLCDPPWTGACQAPLSIAFSHGEYWMGVAISFSRDLPGPGFDATSLHWQADSLPLSHRGGPDSLGYFILNSTWLRTWGKHWVGSSFALPAPERTILGCWSVLPHERFLAVCRVPACPPLPSPDRHTPLHRREDSWFSL